jgi:hypothetical protein
MCIVDPWAAIKRRSANEGYYIPSVHPANRLHEQIVSMIESCASRVASLRIASSGDDATALSVATVRSSWLSGCGRFASGGSFGRSARLTGASAPASIFRHAPDEDDLVASEGGTRDPDARCERGREECA